MAYFSTHNHSSYSNLRMRDAILRLDEMIQYANDIGLKGICVSEHEVLSSNQEFLKTYRELKEKGKIRPDFKVGLGNEIYLCHEDSLEELKENAKNREPMTKFYHFLLLAVNENGYKQLRKLSSLAWENMFSLFGMERVPTFKHNLKKIIQKGDVIGTTACAGSFIGQMIINASNAEEDNEKKYYKQEINNFINFCIEVFGKTHFFLELQPSNNPEQIIINKELLRLSEYYDLRYTIATDGHYLKKESRGAHRTYLQSENAEREVDAFYEATFIQSEEEVKEYLSPYLSEDIIQQGFDTTIEIMNMMEEYSLDKPTSVPTPEIPDYVFEHVLEQGYEQYPYIKKFAYSEYPIDRYYLHLIQEGLMDKIVNGRKADKEYFHVCLDRINTELKEVWNISEKMHERISAYYVLVSQVVDIMWNEGDSLVGVSRGCFEPNSKVLLPNGLTKSIKDIEIGESVVTHLGNSKEVKDIMVYPIKEMVTRLQTSSNDPIICTKDHEILSIKVEECTAPSVKNKYCTTTCKRVDTCKYSNINKIQWNPASSLKRGDWVVYPRPKLIDRKSTVIDLADYVSELNVRITEKEIHTLNYTHIRESFNRFIDFNDEDIAWFFGAFIGNGWTRNDDGRFGLAFHSDHKHKIERATNIMKRLTGKEPSIVNGHQGKQVVQLVIGSMPHNAMLKALFGSGAINKIIPDIFIESSDDIRKWILQGLFDTDGHIKMNQSNKDKRSTNKVTYSSISYNLTSQIKMLMAHFGYLGQIKRRAHKQENWNDELQVCFTGKQLWKMKEEILPEMELLDVQYSTNYHIVDNDYIYFRVHSNEEIEYDGYVYDLKVDDDESYVVEQTVVHNSAGGYLTVYLMSITQLNPLDYNLPHYRHLTAERPELPDKVLSVITAM